MRLKYGNAMLTTSRPTVVRAIRPSGSSPNGFTGSSLSQYGSDRRAGSAESRLWRCVVPVRGSPQMMIGRRTGASRISGWRTSRSSSRRRLRNNPVELGVDGDDPTGAESRFGFKAPTDQLEALDEVRQRRSRRGRSRRPRRPSARRVRASAPGPSAPSPRESLAISVGNCGAARSSMVTSGGRLTA